MKLSVSLSCLMAASSVTSVVAVSPFRAAAQLVAVSAVEARDSLFSRNYYKRCGNGKIDKNEQCDPKYGYGGDRHCDRATCKCKSGYKPVSGRCQPVPKCGNGIIDTKAGEECDPHLGTGDTNCNSRTCKCKAGYRPSAGGPCFKACTGQYEVLGPDHRTCVCRPGYHRDESQACVPDTLCGNRQLDVREQCDGGYRCTDQCFCPEGLYPDGKNPPGCKGTCGNGMIDLDNEEECDSGAHCDNCVCDIPPYTVPDGLGDCTACGNGEFNLLLGEQCDGSAAQTGNCLDCCIDCMCRNSSPNFEGGCNYVS